MILISYTLTYAGTTKSFAEWKLTKPHRYAVSQSIGFVGLTSTGEKFDADLKFAQGSTVIIRKLSLNTDTNVTTTTQWFVGRVEEPSRFGSVGFEGITYLLVDPLWYLVQVIYQIYWKERATPGDPNSALVNKYLSEIFLNKSITDTVLTTAQQMADALQFCLDTCALAINGSIVPFQFSSAEFPSMNIPIDKVVDAPCLAVIVKQLAYMPDSVMWVDHATTPPTIHIKRRAAIISGGGAVSINIAGKPTSEIEIKPRYDLQRPSVCINFRIVNNNNGTPLRETQQQIAPNGATGREIRAVVSTVNLEGFNLSGSSSSTNTRAVINADAANNTTKLNWWKGKLPWLSDARISGLTIGSVVRPQNYTYELVGGTLPASSTVHTVRETITAIATFDVVEGGITKWRSVTQPISVEITSTDASTGSYSGGVSGTLGEPIPANLASNFYAAVSFLHYEGRITLKERELTSPVSIGNVLNLIGGRAEWATMNAVVQSVDEDMETGLTVITFGPPTHLGIADLVELLRFNSQRVVIGSNASRVSGAADSSSGAVQMPANTPLSAPAAGWPSVQAAKFIDPSNAASVIDLDPVECGGHTMKPRLVENICVNGVNYSAFIMMSEYFH